MSRFFNKQLNSLTPYTPGEQPSDMKYVKLNTNESPFPPSPEVISAVCSDQAQRLNLYPDPECTVLRQKIADLYGVGPENVFVGNGSDDILNFAFVAFGGQGVVFPEISYGFYKVFAQFNRVEFATVALNKDYTINPADYFGSGKMVVLANPNAPTGIALSAEEIEEIVKSNQENVVLVDEAYVDFGAESCTGLVEKYQNLIVVQTFSKSRSLAGARLGFAIGHEELIKDLNTIKYSTNPYSINRMTNAAGIAAIESNDYYKNNCRKIIRIRENTKKELEKLGFCVLPSKCNFLFAKKDGIDGEFLYARLKDMGILVRHFDDGKINQFIRITIGTQEQMTIFLNAGKSIIEVSENNENK